MRASHPGGQSFSRSPLASRLRFTRQHSVAAGERQRRHLSARAQQRGVAEYHGEGKGDHFPGRASGLLLAAQENLRRGSKQVVIRGAHLQASAEILLFYEANDAVESGACSVLKSSSSVWRKSAVV